MPEARQGLQDQQLKTIQFREFGTVNLTDARTALEDKELYWAENGMPIGKGNWKVVPGQGSTFATCSPHSKFFGFTLKIGAVETPVLLTVNTDGSMQQVNTTNGVVTTVCAAGQLTTAARLAIWKDTPVLIVDPVKGYCSWDGTTFTVLDASKLGTDLAVFEARVWIVTATRTITFTAPNSFSDFTSANGGGSVTISDSVFAGSITKLHSALEQLWIVGPGAVNAISNVQTTGSPLITTFSNTNIVSNVGTSHPSSVVSFFRTFLFLNHYGVYALVGATPQKLSAKLDGLWPSIAFTMNDDIASAVTTIYDVFTACWLVNVADPFTGIARPLMFCFTEGKWFFGSQGASLLWITSLLSSDGDPLVWGSDGTHIYQLFANTTATVSYRFMTKLFDFGDMTQVKEMPRVALDFQSPNLVSLSLTVENEFGAKAQTAFITPTNVINWTGLGGAPLIFTGAASVAIVWVASGLQVVRQQVQGGIFGRYLGLTLTGSSAPFTLSGAAMQVRPGAQWN